MFCATSFPPSPSSPQNKLLPQSLFPPQHTPIKPISPPISPQQPHHSLTPLSILPLRAPTPHILQQAISLRQPVQTVVALAHRADEAAQRVDLVLARVAAVLVHLADGNLHRGVVFGFDDPVGRGAFAGDVAGGGGVSRGVLRGVEGGWGGGAWAVEGRVMDIQVDKLASVVFHDC